MAILRALGAGAATLGDAMNRNVAAAAARDEAARLRVADELKERRLLELRHQQTLGAQEHRAGLNATAAETAHGREMEMIGARGTESRRTAEATAAAQARHRAPPTPPAPSLETRDDGSLLAVDAHSATARPVVVPGTPDQWGPLQAARHTARGLVVPGTPDQPVRLARQGTSDGRGSAGKKFDDLVGMGVPKEAARRLAAGTIREVESQDANFREIVTLIDEGSTPPRVVGRVIDGVYEPMDDGIAAPRTGTGTGTGTAARAETPEPPPLPGARWSERHGAWFVPDQSSRSGWAMVTQE